MDMFVGHLPELIVLLVLVVFIFGAKRLPEVGSGLGKGIAEFRSSITGKDDPQGNSSMTPAAPKLAEVSSPVAPAPTFANDTEPLHT
jgi:sec-independent protein translocase protein TatA